MTHSDHDLRRRLPAVHELLAAAELQPPLAQFGRDVVRAWIRDTLELIRAREAAHRPEDVAAEVFKQVVLLAEEARNQLPRRVINATGIILHTGLGRAPLAAGAVQALAGFAGGGNVEFELLTGKRSDRGERLQPLFRQLTGCESSLVVNNNAAATLLVLQVLCAGREVVISRGQLVEIGGSFRLPDVFSASGARLREVGATNRTRLADYEAAIGPDTAAILRVHASNYRIVGFADEPDISELSQLAKTRGVLSIDDIGSGALVNPEQFGLPAEPTFPASLAAGADLVLGSGDKLLGGPQAGIILGRKNLIETLGRHPLARALRIDKLTLAALAATLQIYCRGAATEEIPVLSMLKVPLAELQRRAASIALQLNPGGPLTATVETELAAVGGGSLPGAELPTAALAVRHDVWPAEELARRLRTGALPIVGRIRHNRVLIDLRSVLPEDDGELAQALREIAG